MLVFVFVIFFEDSCSCDIGLCISIRQLAGSYFLGPSLRGLNKVFRSIIPRSLCWLLFIS